VTATSSDPATETPKRGVIAAAIALGAHAVVVLAAFLAGRLVNAEDGGGMQDLAAVVMTLLGGEIITGLACLVVSALEFRRGRRYTGLALMGGWLLGLLVVVVLLRPR
jgi:hypothetical protein